jgi:subtilisin
MSRLTFRLALPLSLLVLAATATASAAAAPPERRDEQIPGRYIVLFEDSVERPGEATRERERAHGFQARHRYSRAVRGFAAQLSPGQVRKLEADRAVEAVVPDRRVRALGPLAAGETAPTGVRRIEAATATTVRGAASGAVAVIDTGIDLQHPDLKANAVDGINCIDSSASAQDDQGHGTHVAGTIAAGNAGSGVVGVAPGTKLYAVKVLDASGSGSTSSVVCGIDWVTKNAKALGIRVANMSLGGPGQPVQSCSTTTDPQHRAICVSSDPAGAGVLYVVAAGNSGWDFDYARQPDVPAAYPQVVTVTAMADSDGRPGASGTTCSGEYDDRYASFSNFAAIFSGAAHAIAGPGVCIVSTGLGGGTMTASGTSMATPHLAAAAALCIGEGTTAGPCAGLASNNPGAYIAELSAKSSDSSYGFYGDPNRPVSGRWYGHLAWPAPLDTTTTDTTAPEVASVSPADGATGVAATANVSVTFSEAMDKAATQGAFSLVRAADGSTVTGTFSWAGDTMTFDPSSDLAADASYVAKLTTAAKDSAGNAVTAEKTWTFAVAPASVSPGSASIYYGSLRSGDVTRLTADDDAYLAINSTTSGSRVTDWYGRMYQVPNSLQTLKVTYKGKSSATCDQSIWIYSWTKGQWERIDARKVGTTEAEVTVAPSGTLADYVSGSSGDGDVAVRIRCSRGDSVNFYTSADLLKITYTR